MPKRITTAASNTLKENVDDFETAACVLRNAFGTRSMHTSETDMRLFALYSKYGSKWRTIANEIGGFQHGFTEDVCRNRVIRVLKKAGNPYKPVVARCAPRKPNVQRKWTQKEDELLIKLVGLPDKFEWDDIQCHFPERTKQALRNRSQRVIRLVKECKQKNVPIEYGIGGRDMQEPKHSTNKKHEEEEEEEEEEEDITPPSPCPEFQDFLPSVTYSPLEIENCHLEVVDETFHNCQV